ncbi:hypothetical protein [Dactylosporangium sp. CA-233914]|uniref:golvesin C-terminal-like domain-containing protein n=1 Tax=Dactylosporangium sp. CA-233914 TaxID=3239934 RepID=UPI003D8AFE6D
MTALFAVLTVVVGVFWQLIAPRPRGTSASPPGYTAVAGWDCTTTSDHGIEVHGRTEQWRTVAGGGWSQDGCRGTFQTLPMTGDADSGQYVQWWFTPAAGGQCRVDVYVPRGPAATDSGATAARYAVLAGRSGAGYAEFMVNQAQNTGQWVNAGTFPLHGNEFTVRLTTRGTPEHPGDRTAVSALRVTCDK